MSVMAPFLLSLGCRSKQASDRRGLPQNVSFFHSVHLALAKHVHHLVAGSRSPPRLEGKEAHPWLHKPFDKPMILLNQVGPAFRKKPRSRKVDKCGTVFV